MKLSTRLPRLPLVVVLGSAAVLLALYRDRLDLEAVEQLVRHLSIWAPAGLPS